MKTESDVRQASPNIFADLKLPDAGELNAKAQVAYRICRILDERKLTQTQAAQVLGVDQPKVSALMRGKLEGFSSDRLFRFLNALDLDVDIIIRPTKEPKHHGSVRVLAEA